MTETGLVTVRLAATLAHALPGTRLRLRDRNRHLLEVSEATGASPEAMSPCAFRRLVARAQHPARSAAPLASLTFLSSDDLALDIGVRSGDRIWPSGTYRVGVGDVHVHAFVTTLAPRHCRCLIRSSARVSSPVGVGSVRLHRDVATEVTLVHALTPVELGVDRHPALEELLVRAVDDEVVGEPAAAARS